MQLNAFIIDVILNIYESFLRARKVTGKNIIPSGGLVSDGIPYIKEGMGASTEKKFI